MHILAMAARRSRRRFRYLDLCLSRDPDLCRSRLRRCSPSPIKREAILSSGLRVCICALAPTKLSFAHTDLLSAACLGICVCGVRIPCRCLGIWSGDPAHRNLAAQFNLDSLCTKGSCVACVPRAPVYCVHYNTSVLVRLTIVRTSTEENFNQLQNTQRKTC